MPGVVEVVATDRPESFVVRLDGRDQSHVDLADPTRLVFDYVARMAGVVDAAAPAGVPLRVVHVGGGGLTLPRYVAATRPTSAQIVLEPDAELTRRVREELALPRRSGIKVREADGRTGVRALRVGAADLLLVDAFDGGHTPADLLTREALSEQARALAPSGWLVVNIVDRAPFASTRRVLAAHRERLPHLAVGAEAATWKGRAAGNLVVVASRTALPPRVVPADAAGRLGGYRVLEGRAVDDALGGGVPLLDADLGSAL